MKKKYLVMFFSFLFVAGFTNTNPFNIQSDDLKEKELLALKGDPVSADDLSFFYAFSENNQNEIVMNKVKYWASIAAENDSTGRCQYNYFVLITSDGYKLDLYKRGLFWLYKSSQLNYKNAIDSIYLKKDDPLWFSFADDTLFRIPISNETEIETYKEAAICGSGNAALRLSEIYKNQEDKKQYEYWLRIGAQNGSKECMKEYVAMLRESSDEYDNIRAEFWEKK